MTAAPPHNAQLGYEYDVFFCFAEGDNEPLREGEDGWIDELARYVEADLRNRGVARPRLRVQPSGHAATPHVVDELRRSATIVIVLSSLFLDCAWRRDQRQLEALHTAARTRPNCLILIEKSEVPGDLTAELESHARSRFWSHRKQVTRTLGYPQLASEIDPHKQVYLDLVAELGATLAAGLLPQRMPPRQPEPADRDRTDDRPRCRVFLTACGEQLEHRRLDVWHHLRQAGFDVVSSAPPPSDPEAREQEAGLISEAQLFIQLLPAAVAPERSEIELAERQLDIALAAGCEILQWLDPTVELADVVEPHLRRLLHRDTVYRETIPAFCTAVERAARKSTARARRDQRRTASPQLMVFVDAHPKDKQQLLQNIFGHYQQIERYQHILWTWDDVTLSEVMELVEEVTAVVLFWGDDGAYTVGRYRKFLRAFVVRKRCTTRLVIYDGPPNEKSALPGVGGWKIFPARNGKASEDFCRFLEQLSHA
jgi:hypothetical protein